MTRRRGVVHWYIMKGSENDGTFCGVPSEGNEISFNLANVTCKRCLKGRKLGKGGE